ncbi:hypothetical protein ABT001_35670, partial [Streptomyces sp. NPDC002793]|uniref:hypothetical protein n=1 Tax=Streptomyces sp. NPDC002793 TaxID=3154432 RepID=UPI003318B01E
RDPSAISESDRSGQHVFRPSGLMISIHCARDILEAIELGRPSSQKDRVLFQGVDVFAPPAREVVRRVGELTSIEEDPDDDASFIAPDLLLSFWRPFAADDEPEEERGYYFSSVLLARPGYYDTPFRLRSDSSRARDCPVRMPTGLVSARDRSRSGRTSGA